MTIFLADISSYEHGLKVADLTDCAGILAKCTEGTYYTDADYDGWRQQAKAAGKLFIPYHFISGEDPAAQAAHLAAHIGDTSLPVMLDWEPEGNFSPSLAQLLAVADAVNAARMRTRLAYVPRWYWSKLGGPDLSGLTSRGLGMISSAYPGGSGTAAQLYPGDYAAAGWQPYGGVTPMLDQFTNQASDGGQLLDMNAYKGTAVQFAAFLGAPVPTPTGGIHMGTYVMSAGWKNDYPDVATQLDQHIPVGTNIDDGDAAAYSMVRSFVAVEYARQARDEIRALAAKAGQPVVTDVPALAAALGPLLHPTTDSAAIVAALLPHLPGPPDPAVFITELLSHIKVTP